MPDLTPSLPDYTAFERVTGVVGPTGEGSFVFVLTYADGRVPVTSEPFTTEEDAALALSEALAVEYGIEA